MDLIKFDSYTENMNLAIEFPEIEIKDQKCADSTRQCNFFI